MDFHGVSSGEAQLRDRLRQAVEQLATKARTVTYVTNKRTVDDMLRALEDYDSCRKALDMHMGGVPDDLAEKGRAPVRCDYCGVNRWALVTGSSMQEPSVYGKCESCGNLQEIV